MAVIEQRNLRLLSHKHEHRGYHRPHLPRKPSSTPLERTSMSKLKAHAAIFVLMLLALIAAGGWLISSFSKTAVDPELQMGLLVVFAITSLMTVLFIVAAGFSSMELTDAKQALGL